MNHCQKVLRNNSETTVLLEMGQFTTSEQ